MKKALLGVLLGFLALLVFLLGAELVVRGQGHEPWAPGRREIQVVPGGELYQPDPVLGYRHRPGPFAIRLTNGYKWVATHGQDTLRRTRAGNREGAGGKGLWVFGCSFTHGWSLEDDQTYPWKLQEKLPTYDVRNFGVGGYGTLQSYLQLDRELESADPPEICVLAYADFHDARNTFLRERRKSVITWNTRQGLPQPHAWLNDEGELEWGTDESVYREFPGMRRFAFAHFLEQRYNEREAARSRSHDVSKAIIERFQGLCEEHGIRLFVAGISDHEDTADVLAWCRERGIAAGDISVPLDEPGNRNLPHNAHPSARANQEYARRLRAGLEAEGWLDGP